MKKLLLYITGLTLIAVITTVALSLQPKEQPIVSAVQFEQPTNFIDDSKDLQLSEIAEPPISTFISAKAPTERLNTVVEQEEAPTEYWKLLTDRLIAHGYSNGGKVLNMSQMSSIVTNHQTPINEFDSRINECETFFNSLDRTQMQKLSLYIVKGQCNL